MDEAERRRQALLAQTTQDPGGVGAAAAVPSRPTLTVLGHPDPQRIGERAVLAEGATVVSRVEPDFRPPDQDGAGFPLADPFLSRRGLLIQCAGSQVELHRAADAPQVRVDGAALEGHRRLGPRALEDGVVITLRERVVLLLHAARPSLGAPAPESTELLGDGDPMQRVRADVARIAAAEIPVLILGESGTGKELVARALHRASRRAAAPCVCLDMGAVPPSVAASQLFGHVKGAFTGADRSHDGAFAQADGGTLFLDEIGETPPEVQVMLLRALETGGIRPVGAARECMVDVRVLAATDGDLEALVEAGRFKAPLLHRLAGLRLELPPLRTRREDLGRLLLHFLTPALREAGAADRLDRAQVPWLSARVVERLARHRWPGNVRELKNVARHMAYAADDAEASLPATVRSPDPTPSQGLPIPRGAAEPDRGAVARARPAKPTRRPGDVSIAEVKEALRAHRWHVEATAKALGLSKGSLYALMERTEALRTAKDVSTAELAEAHAACGGDLDRMSERLEVSKAGLRLRLREL